MRGLRILGILAGVVALVGLILWSGGFLETGLIEPDQEVGNLPKQPEPAQSAAVELRTMTEYYDAVGTVRPRVETKVEAQVTAKVLSVEVTSGQKVQKGDLLVVLDSRELRSQLEEARQGLESAKAQRSQAERAIDAAQAAFEEASARYRRIKTLYAERAVASSEMDQAEASYLQAEAALQRAKEGRAGAEASVRQAERRVEQSEIALSYAEIRAHESGEIAERMVEPGDLAIPGKALLYLQTSGSLRLEAMVREGLIGKARPGTELEVEITSNNTRVKGVVEEVVPSADPKTRTFLVKVGLPPMTDVYPGMYGRVLVPMLERKAIFVPAPAVRRTGQMETVQVLDEKAEEPFWRTVFIKTGQKRGDMVEVLAGLEGGETVGVPENYTPATPEAAPQQSENAAEVSNAS